MMSPKGDIRRLPGSRLLATSAVEGIIVQAFPENRLFAIDIRVIHSMSKLSEDDLF